MPFPGVWYGGEARAQAELHRYIETELKNEKYNFGQFCKIVISDDADKECKIGYQDIIQKYKIRIAFLEHRVLPAIMDLTASEIIRMLRVRGEATHRVFELFCTPHGTTEPTDFLLGLKKLHCLSLDDIKNASSQIETHTNTAFTMTITGVLSEGALKIHWQYCDRMMTVLKVDK